MLQKFYLDNFIACTGSIRWSLKVPYILCTCTSIFPLTSVKSLPVHYTWVCIIVMLAFQDMSFGS